MILLFAIYYVHTVFSDKQIRPPLISVSQEIRFSKSTLLVPVVPREYTYIYILYKYKILHVHLKKEKNCFLLFVFFLCVPLRTVVLGNELCSTSETSLVRRSEHEACSPRRIIIISGNYNIIIVRVLLLYGVLSRFGTILQMCPVKMSVVGTFNFDRRTWLSTKSVAYFGSRVLIISVV